MDYMPEYSDNDYRLYHHGILGMKWGKRNGPPYPLGASDHSASERKAGWRKSLSDSRAARKERKAEREARTNYDYRESDRYKNSSNRSRSGQDRVYESNKLVLGTRSANRIEYDVRQKGISRSKAYNRQAARQIATGVAVTAGFYIGSSLLTKGLTSYFTARDMAKISGEAFKAYARVAGLNTIKKGGFTFGAKQVAHGAELFKKYSYAAYTMFS